MVREDREQRQEPAWMKWTTRVLGYLAATVLGFVMCFLFLNWLWAPALGKAQRYDQIMEMLQHLQEQQAGGAGIAAPGGGGVQSPGPESQQQSIPQQRQAQPEKGNNGKH